MVRPSWQERVTAFRSAVVSSTRARARARYNLGFPFVAKRIRNFLYSRVILTCKTNERLVVDGIGRSNRPSVSS